MMRPQIIIGFVAGWVTHLGVWLGKDFHGGLESITQPFIAAVISAFFVGICILLAKATRGARVAGVWTSYRYLSLLLIPVGITCLFFAERLGLTHETLDPELGQPFQAMNGYAAAVAYLFVIFPIVNWPRRRAEPGAPPNGGPAERLGNSDISGGPPSVS